MKACGLDSLRWQHHAVGTYVATLVPFSKGAVCGAPQHFHSTAAVSFHFGLETVFFLSDLDSFSQFHFSPYPFCTMSESPCPCQFIAISFLFLHAHGNLSLLVFSLHETIGEGSVTRLETDEISLLDTGNRLPTQPRANSASPPSPELSC